MKNKTVVEWMVDVLKEYGSPIPNSFIEQAKKMEEEQIITAYEEGGSQTMGVEFYAEQYYIKTYKIDK